jgi:NAD(P)-dependent dehydrogenase (short-subunit alcohol dehydrogenase family)
MTRVLITAGAAGIGAETARAFAETGAEVHVCDRDRDALAAFSQANPGITAIEADVTRADDASRVFAEIEAASKGLDVLVNNAGIGGPTGPIETLKLQDWQACLSVNLDSLFLYTRLAAPIMKAARSGCIVNMSSTAGILGYPMRTPYAASKWAVVGLTKSLAMELGPWGVRVNAICPGPVEGARIDRVIAAEAAATGRAEDEVRRFYTDASSMRTFIAARDIANMIVFLASPAAAKVSGQAIPVDGHTETMSRSKSDPE